MRLKVEITSLTEVYKPYGKLLINSYPLAPVNDKPLLASSKVSAMGVPLCHDVMYKGVSPCHDMTSTSSYPPVCVSDEVAVCSLVQMHHPHDIKWVIPRGT